MIPWIIGYVLGAVGTFVWIVSENWAYCDGVEDCLLTLLGNVMWGAGWPLYWTLEFF